MIDNTKDNAEQIDAETGHVVARSRPSDCYASATPFLDSIVCGDNVAVMCKMPSECIDLTVTSPPYDNLRKYGGHDWDFEAVARELFRITKKGGVVVWVVSDMTVDGTETGNSFRQALYFKECGFRLHDTMIYHKHSPPLTHNRYEQHFEFMFILSKMSPITFNPLMEKKIWEDNRITKAIRREKDGTSDMGFPSKKEDKIKGNVWKYNIGGGHVTSDKCAYDHPAIFPEQLAADHIASWSNEGDIVLDPFSGSGTTCKMARKLGRHWIGIEINPEYIQISNQRMAQAVMF